jgi:hypothetical protein
MPMRDEKRIFKFHSKEKERSGGGDGGGIVVVCASISVRVSHSFMSSTNAHFSH